MHFLILDASFAPGAVEEGALIDKRDFYLYPCMKNVSLADPRPCCKLLLMQVKQQAQEELAIKKIQDWWGRLNLGGWEMC